MSRSKTSLPVDPVDFEIPQRKPFIGEIVNFVLVDKRGNLQIRPAIVTRVWSETCVQLTVFPDGSNDIIIPQLPGMPMQFLLIFAVSSATKALPSVPLTWHFPGEVFPTES